MNHPNPVYWYSLKDKVKLRCGRLCEWCWWRLGDELHHRHYDTWGRESPRDVMLLCGLCHDIIGGYRSPRTVTCWPGCLLLQGDNGKGMNSQWLAYLGTLPLAGPLRQVIIEEKNRPARERMYEVLNKEWERVFGPGGTFPEWMEK